MKRTMGMIAGALLLALTPAMFAADGPTHAAKELPWENSLGMKFVPVKGTDALFCIWLTRVQDFAAFVKETQYDATANMVSLGDDGWKTTHGDSWESPGYPQGPTHPVGGMSWTDAKAFCQWLTGKERKDGKIGADEEYRLPTDAEWSLAVGLGPEAGDTPKSKSSKIKGVYPWGTQWPPPKGAGNYAGEESKEGESTPQELKKNKAFNDVPSDWTVIQGYNDGYPRTSPVGSYPANEFGLYDMGGNLYQWCEDLLSKGAPVMRGTSFYTYKQGYILSSFRNSAGINHRCGGTGFRVVLSRSGSTPPSQ